MTSELEIVNWIFNNGVAVGVMLWFMIRHEKALNNLTGAITAMKEAISQCPKK